MTDSAWFYLKALFLGIVEGLTEFIPVSSTAHLLILGDWINFSSGENKVYEVVIQFGSILAVMWVFRARLWQLGRGVVQRDHQELLFARNLAIAFLPAAVIGAVAISFIKSLFHNPAVFVFTLVVGGIIMLWVERKPHYAKNADETVMSKYATAGSLEAITWKQALIVGFAQCVAMVPGTSRSGATIIGACWPVSNVRRPPSFLFLAMPTMLAATVYDLYRHGGTN